MASKKLMPARKPPCLADPDRWAEGGNDPELKALCRGCPRRWLCAKEALETPAAVGHVVGRSPPQRRPRTHVRPASAALVGRPRRPPRQFRGTASASNRTDMRVVRRAEPASDEVLRQCVSRVQPPPDNQHADCAAPARRRASAAD